MDLKHNILSAVVGESISKKTQSPYTYADIVFKGEGENGVVICKRVFILDYEKSLLKIK
jgi:hypothetical protein